MTGWLRIVPGRAYGILAALALAGSAPADGYVDRRGGASRLVGDVELIDEAGVHLRTDGGRLVVAWDRVRAVRSDLPLPSLASYVEQAESCWRARSRVERGDHARAEPLLEALFESTRGQTHETALVVAEGLLRCLVARGAHEDAVIPALEVVRLRRAGVRTDSYGALPSAVDVDAGVCRVLAPEFAAPRRARRLARELEAYAHGLDDADAALRVLAELYRAAAIRAAGDEAVALPDADAIRRERLGWFADLVIADTAAVPERRAARERLEQRVGMPGAPERDGTGDAPGLERWQQAWGWYAIGRALLHEPDADHREGGALALLHVPARYASEQPYLAGLALADASAVLAELGDVDGARALDEELARRWPAHPARAGQGTLP